MILQSEIFNLPINHLIKQNIQIHESTVHHDVAKYLKIYLILNAISFILNDNLILFSIYILTKSFIKQLIS
jgi:hypothetical protein